MGLKIFNTKLSSISKNSNLFLTTRIKKYNKEYNDEDLLFSYFLGLENKFTLGQVQKEEYKTNGFYPIVDQSKNLIVGYTDKKDLVYKGILPIIVFGDHTRNFKYIDFPFVQGADGIKVISPDKAKVNIKFYYYLLSKISVPSRGYNRHYSILKKQKYPNIDLNIQNIAIKQIEPIEKEIQTLKLQKEEHLEIINDVFSEEYNYAKTLWKEFGKGMTAGTQKSHDKTMQIYTLKLSDMKQSDIFRLSCRFHNPITKKLNNILNTHSTRKIKNIVIKTIQRGVSPKYNSDGEISVIKTAQLKNNNINLNECELVTNEFLNIKERARIIKDDVLIASTGKVSLGKIDISTFDDYFLADGHITILRVNKKLYSSLFLTYFLRSILGTYQIERDYTEVTNQIDLYSSEIGNFKIPNFTLEHQKKLVTKIKTKIDSQKDIDKQIKQKQDEISKIIEDSINA